MLFAVLTPRPHASRSVLCAACVRPLPVRAACASAWTMASRTSAHCTRASRQRRASSTRSTGGCVRKTSLARRASRRQPACAKIVATCNILVNKPRICACSMPASRLFATFFIEREHSARAPRPCPRKRIPLPRVTSSSESESRRPCFESTSPRVGRRLWCRPFCRATRRLQTAWTLWTNPGYQPGLLAAQIPITRKQQRKRRTRRRARAEAKATTARQQVKRIVSHGSKRAAACVARNQWARHNSNRVEGAEKRDTAVSTANARRGSSHAPTSPRVAAHCQLLPRSGAARRRRWQPSFTSLDVQTHRSRKHALVSWPPRCRPRLRIVRTATRLVRPLRWRWRWLPM